MPLDEMPFYTSVASFGRTRPATKSAFASVALSSLKAQVTEGISTLREVVLMPRDVFSVIPAKVEQEDDVVVLVHGFFASAGVWRPMKRALANATGAKVASFTHAPGVGIDRIARSLARIVEGIPAGCRIHLVGHSLGGIVSRYYVQELGGHARVSQTISLGSPFGGTERADPFPFLIGRELCRTSPVLARLRSRAHEHDVPHTSFVGEGDLMVVPAASAVFPRGELVIVPRCGHNTLLFHSESIARVVECVRVTQDNARRERSAHARAEL